jgi:acetyl esterase/lipase
VRLCVNAGSIGGDLSKGFLTGGVSAGGNCSTMAAVLARDNRLQPTLTGHMLVCTGMPHSIQDGHGNSVELFPD